MIVLMLICSVAFTIKTLQKMFLLGTDQSAARINALVW